MDSKSSPRTDCQLIQSVKDGNQQAFDTLVERYLRLCQAYFFRKVFNKEIARDLSQEVFISAYHSVPKLAPDSNFKAWLMRVCRNKFLDYLRSNKRREVASERVIAHQPGFESAIVQTDTINQALKRLDPIQQEVVELKYLGDLSCREIAQILEIPEGTVKSHLFYARKRLLELFEDKDAQTVKKSG